MENNIKENNYNKKVIFLIVTLIVLLIIFVIELVSFGILKANGGKYLEESNEIDKDNDVIDNVKEDDNKKDIYYKVFFNEDNGNELKSVEVIENESIDLYTPSKEGYAFTGWTLNDIKIDNNYKVTKDIMLKANWVKQDIDYNNVHVWTNNKGKIQIKVDQINIRERASVSSKDIGDVYNNEIYEVYDIVEDYNYVWYKIKKDNIEGYVADKKKDNYNEYKYTEWTNYTEAVDNVVVGSLDIDEVFVENLVLPDITENGGWFILNKDFLTNTLSNEEAIYLSFYHYRYYNTKTTITRYDNGIPGESFVSFDELNYYYQRIFGKEKSLTPTNIRQYTNCLAYLCLNCDDTNSKEIKYDENDKGYWIKEGSCGLGPTLPPPKLYTDILSAKQVNDEIKVEYNIYWIYNQYNDGNAALELHKYPYNYNTPILTVTCQNKDYIGYDIDLCSKEEIMNIRNEYRSQLPIYEATFKKQSDGKYYYTKGIWKE